MIRALYTATSGMMVESRRMDLMASNLFYAQIPGFKAASVLRAAQKPTGGGLPTDVQTAAAGQFVDPLPGDSFPTDKPLDLALEGDGLFAVQTPGGTAYTRDGRFRKNSQNAIVDGAGNPLLGEGGPIRVPAESGHDAPVSVGADGTVRVDGRVIDRILIQDFPGYKGLQAAGGSLFYPTGAVEPQTSEARVLQGLLERANTSGVVEITKTIESLRAFESYQKMIQTIDETTGEAVRQIGRLA
jgi:flagellar basal-body rod protein FlgF